MGRLEKIVVLTVLFIVAVVLGVALTPGGEALNKPSSPIGGTVEPTDGGKKVLPTGTLTAPVETGVEKTPPTVTPIDGGATAPAPQPPAPQPGVAGTVVTPPVPPAPKAPVETLPKAPAKPFILTTDGLQASAAADMMFYTWKEGDTFGALALHYYGAKEKASRLVKVNEGKPESSLKVGDVLWFPISETSAASSVAEDGQIYVVKSGDMLSAISQKFYGTSKKWQKILDANRDTLASPEKLKPGMRLRIPE